MRKSLTLAVVVFSTWGAQGQESKAQRRRRGGNYPPTLQNATVETYKTLGNVKLNVYMYFPKGHGAADARPAIVFFFGGGWRSGSPKQFEQHCEYLASRGIVAMAADYRVASRHGVKAVACVRDANSAIRWVRRNADRLGIDGARIVAAGGSAGGHLAACSGVLSGFDESTEEASISAKPDAMVLFNPAVVLAAVDGKLPLRNVSGLADRMGVDPEKLSPYHHIAPGAPPTLILHGKKDTTVPFESVQWFTRAMEKAGNRCELIGYDGAAHGFFNYGRDGNKHFHATLREVDRFLTSLGYLEGDPTIGARN